MAENLNLNAANLFAGEVAVDEIFVLLTSKINEAKQDILKDVSNSFSGSTGNSSAISALNNAISNLNSRVAALEKSSSDKVIAGVSSLGGEKGDIKIPQKDDTFGAINLSISSSKTLSATFSQRDLLVSKTDFDQLKNRFNSFSGGIDFSNYYTKTDIDNTFAKKADLESINLTGYAKESWVYENYVLKDDLPSMPNMSLYVTKDNLNDLINEDKWATQEWVKSQEYLTETGLLNGSVNWSSLLSQVIQNNLDEWIETIEYSYEDEDGYTTTDYKYATREWVKSQGYLTEGEDLDLIIRDIIKQYNYVTRGDLSYYVTSDWLRDRGYLTADNLKNRIETTIQDSLNDYVTTNQLNEELGYYLTKNYIENNYYTTADVYSKSEIDDKIKDVDLSSITSQISIIGNQVGDLESDVNTIQSNISSLQSSTDEISSLMVELHADIEVTPNPKYFEAGTTVNDLTFDASVKFRGQDLDFDMFVDGTNAWDETTGQPTSFSVSNMSRIFNIEVKIDNESPKAEFSKFLTTEVRAYRPKYIGRSEKNYITGSDVLSFTKIQNTSESVIMRDVEVSSDNASYLWICVPTSDPDQTVKLVTSSSFEVPMEPEVNINVSGIFYRCYRSVNLINPGTAIISIF